MLEVLMLLTLFVRPVYSTGLLILGVHNQAGQLGVIYIVIALADYLYLAKYHYLKDQVKSVYWVSLIALVIILGMMTLTGVWYGRIEGEFLSSLMSYASLSMAAFLLGLAFTDKRDFRTLKVVLPVFIFILTFVSTEAVLKTLSNWDGLVHAETINDINYQNCTYYAAYALGLNFYQLTSLKHVDEEKNHLGMRKVIRGILYLLLPFQLFTVMCGGGRGGFLLAVGLVLYFILAILRDNKRKAGRIVIYFLVVCIVGGILIVYFGAKGDTIRGFSRITKFLENPQDNERNKQYVEAVSYFLASPIYGNGIGSVWFTLGFYSHDIFCDVLSEGGILLTGTLVVALIYYAVKELKMIAENRADRFGLVIFLFAFVMLLFSGYYLNEPMLWFGLAFTLCCSRKRDVMAERCGVKDENNAG